MSAVGRTVLIAAGVEMPVVGFGVFQIPPDETDKAVATALETGYRHVDTAAAYHNEAGVGSAVRASGLGRDEVFVTTKLWNADQDPARVRPALERSLDELGLDHVDLYLIHWPVPSAGLYAAAWEKMLELRDAGLTRAAGVSNFTTDHLDRVVAASGEAPAVNQVELHPRLAQPELLRHHARLGVATTAWSPLAQAAALQDPVITEIAGRLGRTPAQVVLRWHLQRDTVVIPKSVTPERIRANLDLHDFELAPADVAAIDRLDRGERTGPDPDEFVGD